MTFTSDEQRREVAKKLRALDMSDIEVDGCIIDSPKYVGLLLMRMLDVACDYRDGLHHFPGFFSAQAVVELFADLIEPVPERTCRMIDNGAELCCSECDWRHDYYDEPKFCAGCGAKVVKRD